EISTLSLHDALPIFGVGARILDLNDIGSGVVAENLSIDLIAAGIVNGQRRIELAPLCRGHGHHQSARGCGRRRYAVIIQVGRARSEEHTSELQSRSE